MAGTNKGGNHQKAVMIAKLGSEAKYRKFMAEIGSKGGKNSSGYVFGYGKVDPRVIGKLGGKARWGLPVNSPGEPSGFNEQDLDV